MPVGRPSLFSAPLHQVFCKLWRNGEVMAHPPAASLFSKRSVKDVEGRVILAMFLIMYVPGTLRCKL